MKIYICFSFLFLFCSCKQNKAKTTRKQNASVETIETVPYTEKITGLKFPDWIRGSWHNSAESNTSRFVFFAFQDQALTIRHGLNFTKKEKPEKQFKGKVLSKLSNDSIYKIYYRDGKTASEIEFRLQKLEWTQEPVLTYSITKDDQLSREHLTSVHLVLNKMEEK